MNSRIIKHTTMRLGDLLLPSGPLYRPSEEHLEAREGLLAQLGQYQAVVAYQSAVRGGLTLLLDEQIPLVMVDPNAVGVVTVVDLSDSEATTARAGEAAILDDLLKSLDSSALDALLREASTDSPAVTALLDALAQEHGVVPGVEAGAGGDEFDATPEEDGPTRCQLGDLWIIGGVHRLIVGDCTDPTVVVRLMDGERANLALTDPPYGVSYADKNRYLNAIAPGNRIQIPIENDHDSVETTAKELWEPAFSTLAGAMEPGAVFYVFSPQGGDQMMMMMMMMMKAVLPVKHELIWLKNNHVLGRSDYSYKHEPILYGWKPGAGHHFYGDFSTSVLEFSKPQKSDLHPTTKPIDLVMHLMGNSSQSDDLVIDWFLGSGTTLIAAHRTGRRCYGCEIAPRYGDVILRRAEAEGLTVERVNQP